MKYVPPINNNGDPNAPYVNYTTGVDGSLVPATAVEHPMREILNVITGVGMVPNENDLTQLYQAIKLFVSGSLGFFNLRQISNFDGKIVNYGVANSSDPYWLYDTYALMMADTRTIPVGSLCLTLESDNIVRVYSRIITNTWSLVATSEIANGDMFRITGNYAGTYFFNSWIYPGGNGEPARAARYS
jgi:hypothetical protein